MATADSTTGVCASDFVLSPDLAVQADSQKFLFSLTQDFSLELFAILSAYSDLLDLMDSGLSEYVFLQMLNERFSRLLLSLPRCHPSA